MRNPDPVMLDGKDLPWVEKCEHLGHVFSQSLSMESDSRVARGSFMKRASDLREQLWFAHPVQKMQAIQYNGCAWNVQTRIAFDVPRETHKYVVEGILCDFLRKFLN